MDTTSDSKLRSLKSSGTLNPRSDQVRHPLFQKSSFFDPADLVQLKYETLRAVEVDRCSIADVSRQFGLSRPTIYEAQSQLAQSGLEGLLPHKRGPKNAHKLTDEVMTFLRSETGPDVGAKELAARVRRKFDASIHPRTIQKALKRGQKRGRPA